MARTRKKAARRQPCNCELRAALHDLLSIVSLSDEITTSEIICKSRADFLRREAARLEREDTIIIRAREIVAQSGAER